ncbi:hypothetical protein ACFL1C_01050 [Pseudomonadota bacterium]
MSAKKYSRMNPLLRLLFFLLLSASLHADYQAGLDAYLQGDYDKAIVQWQAVVESPPGTLNDAVRAESLYAIGMLFWLGHGVQQDTYEAASWITLAAELNHPGAQNKLGFLYSLGQGVKQSDFKAFKWWQMAANQGDAVAQFNLGVMYRDGLGVEPDPDKSMQWFREAASNGDPVSAGIVAEGDAVGEAETGPKQETPPLPALLESVPADDYAADENWIARRDPVHYTIQVVALSEPAKLHAFMDAQPELEPFAIYRQTRYKKPLWVLVQGDYADLNLARHALQAFPEDLQKREKLWIRRFERVQKLLE